MDFSVVVVDAFSCWKYLELMIIVMLTTQVLYKQNFKEQTHNTHCDPHKNVFNDALGNTISQQDLCQYCCSYIENSGNDGTKDKLSPNFVILYTN